MQKNSLSLCMIVKDAEETVGRAIKSALAVVDEVVVVDTGSSDNTRLIVEGYGARVVDHPWNDDFSSARNAGLAAAYGDWILVLDADEVLESIRPVEVGRLLSDDEAIAYYARIRNEVRDRATTVYDKVRLFRNHPEIRYRYPIHEQITPAIASVAQRNGGRFLPSPLSVVHHGSVDREDQGKKARNQRLLHRAIEQYPDEPYFHYQLACEMAVHLEELVLPVKGFTVMLEHLQNSAKQVRRMDERRRQHLGYGADLYARLVGCLLACERTEDALSAAHEGVESFGDASSLRFSLARAELQRAAELGRSPEAQQLRDDAEKRLHQMLDRAGDLEPAPISGAYFSVYPHRHLGLLALQRGELEGAREHFRQALSADPDYTGALCGMARVAMAEGRAKDALQIYLKALTVNETEVDAWIGGAEVLLGLGFDDNARSWLQKLAIFLPEHPGVARMIESTRDGGLPAEEAVPA